MPENYTVTKAIGDLNFRRVIPFLVLESSISWVKNLFPSPGAFLFITDVTKIYFYSPDVQKSVIYVRKCIPSSLMQNVEIVSEYFDVEVKLSARMSENSTKCCKIPLHKLKMCCFTFSHKMALNNLFLLFKIYTNFKRD